MNESSHRMRPLHVQSIGHGPDMVLLHGWGMHGGYWHGLVEELKGEYEGKVNIYKVDTEDQQEIASLFGIQSIPSLLFIPVDGQPQALWR